MSKTSFATPKGEIQWATLTGAGKPDLNGRPKYTIDIVCTPEDAAPVIKQLDDLWEEEKPKGAKAPKSTGYKELEDGRIKFTLKTDPVYPSGDPKTIKIYNAAAKQVNIEDKIGNGSTGRASGMAAIYDAGVAARGITLYLDAVQIINLVKYTGGSSAFEADDSGDFDGSEATDGFVAEEL